MSQLGSNDIIVAALKKYNIPVTRENYLGLAYFGDVPDELTAEQELDLPEEVRGT